MNMLMTTPRGGANMRDSKVTAFARRRGRSSRPSPRRTRMAYHCGVDVIEPRRRRRPACPGCPPAPLPRLAGSSRPAGGRAAAGGWTGYWRPPRRRAPAAQHRAPPRRLRPRWPGVIPARLQRPRVDVHPYHRAGPELFRSDSQHTAAATIVQHRRAGRRLASSQRRHCQVVG